MSEIKVEILLPSSYNEDENGQRKEIEGKKFSDTFDDLMDNFGGCTIDNTPLLGGWVDPKTKQRINDENTTYWIVCEESNENIEFFQKYKETLKKRFQQEDIMMYSVRVNRF
ncbi:MAG: hypothetical protein K5798_02565 [Nitrosopumilus sp.]|uniref:hypothetical protein n=1 Tax=Nitrosopumilus sp. TaxID=2024843 RepID=UPI00242A48E4|nr:hypothetical protein [Nitrosopumilus sp.]MCV0366133.1 hypothetical protein [Nitrosopumilus sp.]